MRLLRRIQKVIICGESGTTLLEAVVALAVLGTIAVTFLGGVIATSRAAFMADERATAESLAQSQMEWVADATYVDDAAEYSPAPIPGGKDYIDYSADITVQPLDTPDDGIQKIIVTVSRSGEAVIVLEGYKVKR